MEGTGPVVRQRLGSLVLAGSLIVLGCALWITWLSQTTTSKYCRTGAGMSGFAPVVFVALVILAPIGVGFHARRTGLPITWTLPVVVTVGFIAVVAVYLTGTFWWSAQDCMS